MNIRVLTKISIFSAILSILSIIYIPTPFGVALTLQTFAVSFCGFILGKKYATICVFIYILLGAIGIPVFSGASGGFFHLLGASGGFIWGFLFLAFFSGFNSKALVSISLSLFGLFICHFLGIFQFSIVTKTPFLASFLSVSLPYILKDIASVIFAYICKNLLNKHTKNMFT